MKDYQSYDKETKQLKDKLKVLQDTNAEAREINKQKDLLEETAQMLPNTKMRIESALEVLKNFLSELDQNDALKETEDWQTAEKTLAEATAFVETIDI